MPASERRIPGEDVKKLLAERGIRHYDAAKALGIIGTREEDAKPVGKTITQKDFNIVVEHYRDEFISMAFSRPELLLAMGEIVDEIKTVHCRKEYVQVETWDYFDEVS